jgi:hypothetical protein
MQMAIYQYADSIGVEALSFLGLLKDYSCPECKEGHMAVTTTEDDIIYICVHDPVDGELVTPGCGYKKVLGRSDG